MMIGNRLAWTGILFGMLAIAGTAGAATCNEAKRVEALSVAEASMVIDCDLTLQPGDTVTRQLVFEGKASSDVTLDCNGGKISVSSGDAVVIRSSGDDWQAMAADRPTNITIRNCRLDGGIRIYGLGINGQAERLRQSSLSLGHIQRAQRAAPSGIRLERLTLTPQGRIPLYIAPGVTDVSITASVFKGSLGAPAIYLDAESARNIIRDNVFRMAGGRREVIAVDSSAYNTIVGNVFRRFDNGGIFLYRNCGEGGTIRHQAPTHNVISHNRFAPDYPPLAPAIWLGSRSNSLFWRLATGCALTSSSVFAPEEMSDNADLNDVTNNDFIMIPTDTAVRNNGRNNSTTDNFTAD
jgi:hypothetical protein